MFWPLMASALLILSAYCTITIYHIKQRGLDPSLINYANPLTFKSFWPLRLVIVGGFLLFLAWNNAGYFLLGLVVWSCVLQIFFLIIFQRLPTQPAIYLLGYIITALLILEFNAPGVVIGLVVTTLVEIYLTWWRKNNHSLYLSWVSKRSLKIYKKFKGFFDKLSDPVAISTLHIAVTEDIARPAIVRQAERLYFYLRQPSVISTGIMQVAAKKPMSDLESLEKGSEIIFKALKEMPYGKVDRHAMCVWLSQSYNGSVGYATYLESTYPGVTQAWEKISQAKKLNK